jgi:hypothetical protein
MTRAPIAVFVYDRPQHTAETLRTLGRNHLIEESAVYIFADGPKLGADVATLDRIAAVRSIAKAFEASGHVTIVERDENLGLARSIIAGVSAVVHERGRVIVLEDDIVTSPWFLTFMNDALAVYEDEPRVMSVSGYMYPVDTSDVEHSELLFLRHGISCWGWGTWDRAWAQFEPDANLLMREVRRANRKDFNWGGAFDYFSMLQGYIDGTNNSWGVRWYASVFRSGGYGIFPVNSLVRNIGWDGSGVHCGVAPEFAIAPLFDQRVRVGLEPIEHSERIFRRIVKLQRRNEPHRLARLVGGYSRLLSAARRRLTRLIG